MAYKLLIEGYRCSDEYERAAAGKLDLGKGPQYVVGHSFKGPQAWMEDMDVWGSWVDECRKPRRKKGLPGWWKSKDGESRRACEEIAKEMYHWSDIETGVPREIDDTRRYGADGTRTPPRVWK